MARSSTSILWGVGGLLLGVLLGLLTAPAYVAVKHALFSEQTVGCEPSPEGATRYCVYHRTTPGLLGDAHVLVIGPSAGRGLQYAVPYARAEVSASWSRDTRAVTVAMPGTQVIIERSEYVDSR